MPSSPCSHPSLSLSPPLPPAILGCYVNEAHLRLEEEWKEANTANGSLGHSSVADLRLIEELSSEEADRALEMERRLERRDAVKAANECQLRLLSLRAVADDEHDAKIQLSRRQQNSDEDNASEEEGQSEEGSDDGSAYSADSNSSRQLSSGGAEHIAAASVGRGGKHKLLVATRAMKKRKEEDKDKSCNSPTSTVQYSAASEPEQPPVEQQPCKRSAHTTPRVLHPARNGANIACHNGSKSRSPAIVPPLRLPSSPLPAPLAVSTAADALQATTPHFSVCQTVSLPPATQLQQPVVPDRPSSCLESRCTVVSPAASVELEQVTLAEHAAREHEMKRRLAKAVREEGRQAHKQQQEQQRREQQARKEKELAEDAMVHWLRCSGKALKSQKRKRARLESCTASDEQSGATDEQTDELLSPLCALVPDSQKQPRKEEHSRVSAAVKSRPETHRRGGRYSQLPGTTSNAAKPSVHGPDQRGQQRRDQRASQAEELQRLAAEQEEPVTAERGQALAECWMAEPALAREAFVLHSPSHDVHDSCFTAERYARPSSRSSVAASSTTSSSSSSSSCISCANDSSSGSMVECRIDRARRERVHAVVHFSHLGRQAALRG